MTSGPCVSSSGYINVFQWNKEWFFSRRVKFDSGFNEMAVFEVSWHGPTVIYRFTGIRKWVLRWWKRPIPYSTEVHWCTRTTQTNLDVKTKETYRWFLEFRWVKRFVWFMDRFHSIYSIDKEKTPNEYVCSVGRLTRKSWHPARSFMARTLGENEKKC